MVVATGTVVQGISMAVVEDEVLRHPTSPGKKINTFPARTTKKNYVVLNTVQFNITFQIATV